MNKRIWTLVLCAGESKRFNGVKALAQWGEGALLSHAVKTAQEFSSAQVIVVTGAHREIIISHLSDVHHVHNNYWEKGMGSSIACGVEEVMRRDNQVEAILVLSVDQPLIEQAHLNKMLALCLEKNICVLSTDGEIDSPPAIIPVAYFDVAKTLSGEGLKKSLDQYETVLNVNAVRDADTPEALEALAIASR